MRNINGGPDKPRFIDTDKSDAVSGRVYWSVPKSLWISGMYAVALIGGYYKFTGLVTFGECWHNNHHTFPGSAKIGVYKGQSDRGWWVLLLFRYLGLAWSIQTPESLGPRKELVPLTKS